MVGPNPDPERSLFFFFILKFEIDLTISFVFSFEWEPSLSLDLCLKRRSFKWTFLSPRKIVQLRFFSPLVTPRYSWWIFFASKNIKTIEWYCWRCAKSNETNSSKYKSIDIESEMILFVLQISFDRISLLSKTSDLLPDHLRGIYSNFVHDYRRDLERYHIQHASEGLDEYRLKNFDWNVRVNSEKRNFDIQSWPNGTMCFRLHFMMSIYSNVVYHWQTFNFSWLMDKNQKMFFSNWMKRN